MSDRYAEEIHLYDLALAAIKGISPGLTRQVRERFPLLSEFFELNDKEIALVAGARSEMFSRRSRDFALAAAQSELEWCEANNVRVVSMGEEAFPKRLLDATDAPTVLEVCGDCDLNALHIVSVVGTRHATLYGLKFVERLVEELSAKIPSLLVVSGLAYGIDIAAHRASLDSGVPTAAVVAHGLSTIYPASHRDDASRMIRSGGALITEYFHNAPIHRGNFLARNRIVAAMADATIVVESAQKGGALLTARLASAYDRDVFALPGRVSDTYSVGCNSLIANNMALLLSDADSLIKAMRWERIEAEGDQKTLFEPLPPEQQEVVDLLTHDLELQLNKIAFALNKPISAMLRILGEMEFTGLIVSVPGGKYRLA